MSTCTFVNPKTQQRCKYKPKHDGMCGRHHHIETCTVCLEAVMNNQKCVLKKCGHSFHKKCIDRWTRRSNTCPKCRTVIAEEHPVPNNEFVEHQWHPQQPMTQGEAYNALALVFFEDFVLPDHVYEEAIRVFTW